MKKIYSFLCLLLFAATGFAQVDLPITFEDSSIDYELVGFDGNTSTIVVDPTDPNNMVVEAFRDAAAQTWAGTTAGDNGLANPVPFTADATKMTVRVWSPNANTPIRVKVEDASDSNISVETEVNTTMAMAWETLEFDFSMEAAGTAALDLANTYNKVSVFCNFGTDGATAGEQTYYFDDIMFVSAPLPSVDLPITFENDTPNFYDVSDLGGNVSSIIVDPTNSGNKVMQSIREATATTFAGTIIANDGLANPIPFTETEKKISVRVWSPETGVIIRLKAENSSSPATFGQVDMVSSVANDWETIVFDFESVSGGSIDLANSYDKLTMFFNFGIPGNSAGEQTYYWDDVQFVEPLPVDLPITFEDSNVDYNLVGFDGNTPSIVTDPTDPNNTVVEVFRDAAAQTWAGTTAGGTGLANPIPFTADATKISVRVWSPNADTPIRLKVEDASNPDIFVETDLNTTMAMAWETLEFDFSMQAAGTPALDLANTYNKISIFCNFGTDGATAGEQTYYFDDIIFVVPPLQQVDLPITFEETNVDYNLVGFDGNTPSIVTDPTDPNNTVVEVFRDAAAQTWAGTTAGGTGLANPIPFTTEDTKISVRVWSPNADTPIRLKVEDANDPDIFVETDLNTTMAMAWETLEFDFSMQAAGTPALDLANTYNKISIFCNFGTDGATAGEQTYYFDDIVFVTTPLEQVDLPITFEETDVDYNLVGFDGNTPSIVTDPTDPNNTVVEVFRDAAAQTWAGTTAGGTGLANPIPFTTVDTKISVRVWSPNADTPIRLKVEDANDPDIFVETDLNTTMAMAWETLEFDFSMQAAGTPALDLANTYDKISIFCNFGTDGATAGEQTYYFDDIVFVLSPPLNQVDLPVTFEDEMVDYNFINFGEATSQRVVDPTNPLNMVMETTKPENAVEWAGTIIGNDDGFVNTIPFTATEQKMNVRVWSPAAGMPILLKVENVADSDIFVQTLTNTTVSMEWETLEFDFANPEMSSPALDLTQTYGKGVIFFNFGTTGADAGALTFYWDDVQFGALDVSVDNVATANIKVSPNPANEFINIEFPEAIVSATAATLMDVSGKVMLHSDINNRISQINTTSLSAGTYFLRIDTNTGSYYQKVMIVK